MIKWENNTFGTEAKFYPLLYLVPLPLAGICIFLFGYSFVGDFQLWERIVVAGFGAFFLIYFFKSIEAIKISRGTIKNIAFDGKDFRGETFGGDTFEIDKFSEISKNDRFFEKNNVTFLFHDGGKNRVISCYSGYYYLSGKMEGFKNLEKLLSEHVALSL